MICYSDQHHNVINEIVIQEIYNRNDTEIQ